MSQEHYKTKSIMLFEDNPEDVALVRRALARAGIFFALQIIDDGEKALAFISAADESQRPDLIIIDLNMPKHDGFEIVRAMQKSEILSGVPHVIFSSSISSRDREKARQNGVKNFVTKPAELNDFLETGQVFKSLLAIP